MKAKLYKIFISNDTVHHTGEEVWELFIPDAGIIVNDKYGCFKSKKSRALINNIEIDVDLSYDFIVLCNRKADISENVDNKIDSIFNDFKQQAIDFHPF